MTANEFAKSLRAIADWYDAHPDAPLPHEDALEIFTVHTEDELASVARMLGAFTKAPIGGDLFSLTRSFGAYGLRIVVDRRTACTRRVIRTETVPEHVVPASIREVVEWDCHPILKSDDAA